MHEIRPGDVVVNRTEMPRLFLRDSESGQFSYQCGRPGTSGDDDPRSPDGARRGVNIDRTIVADHVDPLNLLLKAEIGFGGVKSGDRIGGLQPTSLRLEKHRIGESHARPPPARLRRVQHLRVDVLHRQCFQQSAQLLRRHAVLDSAGGFQQRSTGQRLQLAPLRQCFFRQPDVVDRVIDQTKKPSLAVRSGPVMASGEPFQYDDFATCLGQRPGGRRAHHAGTDDDYVRHRSSTNLPAESRKPTSTGAWGPPPPADFPP